MTTDREATRLDLVVTAVPEAELEAAGAVEAFAAAMCFSGHAIQQIRVAVIEACLNALEHSQSPEQTVYLTLVAEADRLMVLVRDFGKGFDPLAVPEPKVQEKLTRLGHKRGWGLLLMRRMMDEVVYEAVETGTLVRMVKYRPRSGEVSDR